MFKSVGTCPELCADMDVKIEPRFRLAVTVVAAGLLVVRPGSEEGWARFDSSFWGLSGYQYNIHTQHLRVHSFKVCSYHSCKTQHTYT